jgi:hypothetical protein
MEMTSKQQHEFSNRTIRDLQEQLSRLSIESSQQEQLAQMVRNERDRLVRDQQAKVLYVMHNNFNGAMFHNMHIYIVYTMITD